MRASGFLSTPSARRATLIPYDAEKIQRISIHALREEGDAASSEKERPNFFISIHALREEGDAGVNRIFLDIAQFLSTPSARRATWSSGSMMGAMSDFYPRPPRGGRPASAAATVASLEFLSTPSARRATRAVFNLLQVRQISIHALREEGDVPFRVPVFRYL